MKVLVTGSNGQLGREIIGVLKEQNINCAGIDIDDVDITKQQDVYEAVAKSGCDIIIHCAAYTAVDKAESDRETCYKTNVIGTRYIAKAAKKANAKLVYISTDYVFDGNGKDPHLPSNVKNPVNYYGLTKSQGEDIAAALVDKLFIVRISWVFGKYGHNFVKTVQRITRERSEINIVNDQIGSPTYTFDLAQLLIDMIKTDKYGVYHATNEGFISWYDFAKAIVEKCGIKTKINPISTEMYPTPAKRPQNSRLDKNCLIEKGFSTLPNWEDALTRYLYDTKDNQFN